MRFPTFLFAAFALIAVSAKLASADSGQSFQQLERSAEETIAAARQAQRNLQKLDESVSNSSDRRNDTSGSSDGSDSGSNGDENPAEVLPGSFSNSGDASSAQSINDMIAEELEAEKNGEAEAAQLGPDQAERGEGELQRIVQENDNQAYGGDKGDGSGNGNGGGADVDSTDNGPGSGDTGGGDTGGNDPVPYPDLGDGAGDGGGKVGGVEVPDDIASSPIGDEPGAQKGLVSSGTKSQATSTASTSKVKVEGKNVVRIPGPGLGN